MILAQLLQLRERDVLAGHLEIPHFVQLHGRDVFGVHVDMPLLCNSFNFVDNMCLDATWMLYRCADRSTTRTRCAGDPCEYDLVVQLL